MSQPRASQADSSHSTPPIVLVGGWLSWPGHYDDFKENLQQVTGRPVYVVPIAAHDWLLVPSLFGWLRLLRMLHATVKKAWEASSGARITIVGHSLGGVLAGTYLYSPLMATDNPSPGFVDRLIALGSPYGSRIVRWFCPGEVRRYTALESSSHVPCRSFLGLGVAGRLSGGKKERHAGFFYLLHSGVAAEMGDGVISVSSTTVDGILTEYLNGVYHDKYVDYPWYGSAEAIEKWWAD